MEIPHIIFDKGKINIQKENSVQSPNMIALPSETLPSKNKFDSSEVKQDSSDVLIDKIRKWALIGFIGLVVIYGAFRLIKLLFGG